MSDADREVRRLRSELEASRRAYDELAKRADSYRAHYESSPDLCITADAHDGTIVECNHTVTVRTGYSADELLGRSIFDLYPPEEHERLMATFQEIQSGRDLRDVEFTGLRKDGTTFAMSLSVTPVVDGEGRVTHGRGVVRDISERREAERMRQHLVRELDHRVKNTLATVQAVADQTMFMSESLHEFGSRFRGRLAALGRIHDAMTENRWEGLELARLVNLSVGPFTGESGRIVADGPSAQLSNEAARSLGMVLHELATNAGKYGALSEPDGSVAIDWCVEQPDGSRRITITWLERGGPPVEPPTRRGFGRRLIEESIAHELRGRVSLTFAPTGVCCEIEFSLASRP